MNAPTISQTLPSAEEMSLAKESARVLSTVLQTRIETRRIDFRDDKGEVRTVNIPTSALCLLVEALAQIGQGNAVSIIPIHAELTTQEAADVLNVSRPFFIQMLEKGNLAFRKVGTHRRVRYQDVIDHKNRIDAKRRLALDDLAEQAQELGMGY